MRLRPLLFRRVTNAYTSSSFVRHKSTSISGPAFQAGDSVLLKRVGKENTNFVSSLQAGDELSTHYGVFKHSDIIGKRHRTVVESHTKKRARLHYPTLAEYISCTPRAVTPIYAGEANLIVSLLDLHVDSSTSARLEILEAGSGHGSLSLHLARAINGANQEYRTKLEAYRRDSDRHPEPAKTTRRAVIHSVDNRQAHSNHATKVVRGFRGGMYSHNVDFYTSEIADWISNQFVRRDDMTPFLDYVVLDLPAPQKQLGVVMSAMRDNAVLAVFCPNITQITDCVRQIAEDSTLELVLDQVVELGSNMGAGRQWEVKTAIPRAPLRQQESRKRAPSELGAMDSEGSDALTSFDENPVPRDTSSRAEARADEAIVETAQASTSSGETAITCRPKMGGIVHAGGFLGLWQVSRRPQST